MNRWNRLLGFTLVAVVLGGCVEFERQTIVYRHDTQRDELRLLMIFEGIYSNSASWNDDDRSRNELMSVLLRPRTFFFSNWLLEYDRDAWVEWGDEIADLREDEPELHDVRSRMRRLVLDNVRVENGTFFLNGENKLSGYQLVTIGNVAEIVAAINEFVNTMLIHGEIDPGDLSLASSEFTENVVRIAAYAGHDWLTLFEGELRLRIPLAAVDYEEVSQDLVNDDHWQEFAQAGARMIFSDGVGEFVVGSPWSSQITLSAGVADGPYEPNLVPVVEAENRMAQHPDLEAIAAWFVDRSS